MCGDLHSIDYERLQSLNPTHVLMDFGNTPKTVVDALDALELPLLSVEMTDPQQNFDLYSLFGAVFSVPMAADTLSRRFEAALARVTMAMRNKTRQRVLYLAQKDPYQTVAKSSYGAALLDLAQLELIGAPETASEMEDGGALAMTESLLLSVNKILFNGSSVKFKRADIKAFAEEFGVPRSKLVRLDNDPNMQFGVRAIDSMDRLIALREKTDA
ncbi:ABC transporter substrate-binding protein [Iodidimonas gelatinilytica]|uniref:ABC transporter substrate-binding protein n=1 Tax=Iodidimonas gelatinilytica TaxID=1236966 RepID=UPI001B2FE9D3|nr:ABC transporter substrate-binding protein [Iodidimonas gelatinilytica]